MAGIKLIADSGATKTEWCIVGGKKRRSFFTTGISPYHIDQEKIESLLKDELSPAIRKTAFSSIHYYGTGCYTKVNANIVKRALQKVFLSDDVNVTHTRPVGKDYIINGNKRFKLNPKDELIMFMKKYDLSIDFKTLSVIK